MFQFVGNGLDFWETKEVAREAIGNDATDRNDAEFGESLEERVVGGHEGEEFGHGVGDARGDDGGEKHF